MHQAPLPRLDTPAEQIRSKLLRYCRLKNGEIWYDPAGQHAVGCGDATDAAFARTLVGRKKVTLAVQDPPYNMVMGERLAPEQYASWSRRWVEATRSVMAPDASLYVWLGADQNNHFQPLPQFMMMMAETEFRSRSLVTLRNQRGYGTSKNWMAVRQELLYYTRGNPPFTVQYTDIPKVLRGYYKDVGGRRTENLARSRAGTIRASNVWVDIQQVFYRMEENVSGCYAQKPLPAVGRIVKASSAENEAVADFFCHAGTTLLACELAGRRCFSMDIDPIFAEITIRRLERYRQTGKTGWQAGNPFEAELAATAAAYLKRTG